MFKNVFGFFFGINGVLGFIKLLRLGLDGIFLFSFVLVIALFKLVMLDGSLFWVLLSVLIKLILMKRLTLTDHLL